MYLLYFILWVIFNGRVTLEICVFGIAVAAVLFAFTCKFMDYSIAKELNLLRQGGRFVRYCAVLIKEIVKANFTVVHMILSEREELRPTLVSFRSDMKTDVGRAFFANAITLTPGTITVTLEGPDYTVHCLDESLADGMDDSVLTGLLKELEGGNDPVGGGRTPEGGNAPAGGGRAPEGGNDPAGGGRAPEGGNAPADGDRGVRNGKNIRENSSVRAGRVPEEKEAGKAQDVPERQRDGSQKENRKKNGKKNTGKGDR